MRSSAAAAAARRRLGDGDARSVPRDPAFRARGREIALTHQVAVPREHAGETILRHWRAVPDDRLAHLVRTRPRAGARAADAGLPRTRSRSGTGPSCASSGRRRTDPARVERGSRRDGADDLLGAQGDGAARLLRAARRAPIARRCTCSSPRRPRRLKRELVPLAEQVKVAESAARKADVTVTRAVLLAIIENLAREEAARRTGAYPRPLARWGRNRQRPHAGASLLATDEPDGAGYPSRCAG